MEKYSLSMRIMHWIMAVLILTLIGVGFYMTNLPETDPERINIYGMHKSFGIIALLLVLTRIVIRLSSHVPALPSAINRRDTFLHNATIFCLYIGMLAMPIAGYTMSVASGHPPSLFGLPVPILLETNQELAQVAHTIHVQGWYVLLALIVLHFAGNVKHYVVEKVNLLTRIW